MSRPAALVALAAVLAAGAAIAFAQPWNSPWWTYADADGAYTGSSLNLLGGYPTRYLDHPGLPVEELGELAFGTEYAAEAATGHAQSRRGFVDRQLLNLDRARPVFRGLAIAVYLLGITLAFVLMARLLGHWLWGLAGALLWLAAPALSLNSIQARPDVALSALMVVFAYAVGRAVQTRAPAAFLGAGFVVGFATMVKMHAAGAGVALLLAGLVRPPDAAWYARLRTEAHAFVRRRAVLAVGGVVLVVAATSNAIRLSFQVTQRQGIAALVLVGASVAAWLAARAVRRASGIGLAIVGSAAGLALPVLFNIPDGLEALVNIAEGLSGGGVNTGIPLFGSPVHLFDDPLRRPFVLFAVAGIAALVGLAERELRPAIWFVAAAVLGVMAQARIAEPRYFAPPYVLSIPGVLWLCRRRPLFGSVAATAAVAYLFVPAWQHRHDPSRDAAHFAALAAPAKAWLASHEKPGEVALTAPNWAFADSQYYGLVKQFVEHTPDYRYRDVPDTYLSARFATDRGLRLRYYVGPPAEQLTHQGPFYIGAGYFVAKHVAPLVVELVSGGGVDRLYRHPDAPYDPWTGYYKDPQGRYWKSDGSEVFNPPRRRYLAKEHLWVDAYGDLWTATGEHAGNRPDLRTAP